MFKFRRGYFLASLLLLAVEVFIALFVQDDFLRPYGGDFLIVVFLYCFLMGFLRISKKSILLLVLFIAFGLETLQYFDLVNILRFVDNKVANIFFGSYFDWVDVGMYSLAAVTIVAIEKTRNLKMNKT